MMNQPFRYRSAIFLGKFQGIIYGCFLCTTNPKVCDQNCNHDCDHESSGILGKMGSSGAWYALPACRALLTGRTRFNEALWGIVGLPGRLCKPALYTRLR